MIAVPVVFVSLLSLVWPELGLALLVYQPVIQHTAVGPVRIGYVIALCLITGLLLAVRRDKPSLWRPLLPPAWISLISLALFFVYMGISAAWSPMPGLAVVRAAKGLAVLAIGWLALIHLSSSPPRLRRFLVAGLAIGLGLTLVGVVSAALSDWHHSLPAIPGEKQGLYRQAVGLTLILALGLFVYGRRSPAQERWRWAALLAAIAVSSWAILQSGSRGALLAVIPVTACVLAGSLRRRGTRFQALAASLAIGLGLLGFVIVNPSQDKVRKLFHNTFRAVGHARPEEIAAEAGVQSPLSEDGEGRSFEVVPQDDLTRASGGGVPATRPGKTRFVWKEAGKGIDADPSLAARLGFYKAALEIFAANPALGSGVGGYWVLTGGCYPHNATLEVAAELGSVGLILLVVWGVSLVIVSWRRTRPGSSVGPGPWFAALVIALVFAIVYAQFGSVLEDNRVLFLLTPTVLLLPASAQGKREGP